jgi:hypothetical protein
VSTFDAAQHATDSKAIDETNRPTFTTADIATVLAALVEAICPADPATVVATIGPAHRAAQLSALEISVRRAQLAAQQSAVYGAHNTLGAPHKPTVVLALNPAECAAVR